MDQLDINQLWKNFVDTVTKHYMDFDGRVRRTQFWHYILVYFVVGLGVSIVGGILVMPGLRSLYGLALLVPTLGITARRLHDIDKPTSWVLILAIPFALEILLGVLALVSVFLFPIFFLVAGLATLISLLMLVALVVLIYFCAQPGTVGPNQYGPDPKSGAA